MPIDPDDCPVCRAQRRPFTERERDALDGLLNSVPWEVEVQPDLEAEMGMDEHEPEPEVPCCDYRDHSGSQGCACPEHPWSAQHPFGHVHHDPPPEGCAVCGMEPR